MNINFNRLTDTHVKTLCLDLQELDHKIYTKVLYVQQKTKVPIGEALEYVICQSPILWAKVFLNWECRDYQKEILNQGKKALSLVLRLGRRLGKTECMCILILWHAYTQPNIGENPNVYDIGIYTPYETQIDLIFKRLKELIAQSPMMEGEVETSIHHKIKLYNNSIILGLTAGAKSGDGGASTRGQRGDLLIFDEEDYIGSDSLTNIMNVRNEDPSRIKIMGASTPCGKHEEFYLQCTRASHRYSPSKEDIKNYEFHGYEYSENKNGNGWTEVYAPSNVNRKILEINPETRQSYLQDLKDSLSELRFSQEVMAEFGDELMGVYKKADIQEAMDEGQRIGHKYTTEMTPEELRIYLKRPKLGPIILGVDWDKTQAGTTMVCLELDKLHRDVHGVLDPRFKVVFRIEIQSNEFTYTNAVNKIISLNDQYHFDWIAVDKGYGEVQVELLHKYGMLHPETNLQTTVVSYQFGEKIEVRDPFTMKKDKKPFKPFMVNNSVMTFERHKMIFNHTDTKMRDQFEKYIVESISPSGIPTYSSKDEHIIDALNLALLMYERKYGELFNNIITSKIVLIRGLTPEAREENKSTHKTTIHTLGLNNGYLKMDSPVEDDVFNRTSKMSSGGNMFSRKSKLPKRGKF